MPEAGSQLVRGMESRVRNLIKACQPRWFATLIDRNKEGNHWLYCRLPTRLRR